jgi:hypothetical protein
MSLPVKLDDLAAAVADRAYGYLVTVGEDGRPHVVAVTPAVSREALSVAQPGRRTRANAATRPTVTVVYPPAAPGGYSLIVDGEATPDDAGIRIVPTSAVLHRPATEDSQPSASGCAADCQPVTSHAASR